MNTKAEAQKKSAVSRKAGRTFANLIEKELRRPDVENPSVSVKERIVRNLIESAVKGDINAAGIILNYSSNVR